MATVTILASSACGIGSDANDTTAEGPLLRHATSNVSGGVDAEIAGTLELEGECLYLRSADHDERYPIVWPNSTRWDSAGEVVILPDGGEVSMAEAVSGAEATTS